MPTDDSRDKTIDFGYTSPRSGSIGDLVWHDLNRDGTQLDDEGEREPGLMYVRVLLKGAIGGEVLAQKWTDGDGRYEFSGLCKGDYVVGMVVVDREDASLLVVSEAGMGKRSAIDAYRLQGRGGKGVINLKTNQKTGKVVAIKSVIQEDQLMVITRNGVINRQRIDEIRIIGRATQGVRLVNLDEGDSVMDVARVFPENGSDGEIESEVEGEGESGVDGEGEVEGEGGVEAEIESGSADVLSEGGGEPGDEEGD